MLHQTFIVIFAIIIGSALCVASQERSLADELLRYFPQGDYTRMHHFEQADFSNENTFALYKRFLDVNRELFAFDEEKTALPVLFRKNSISRTGAEFYLHNVRTETITVKAGEDENRAVGKILIPWMQDRSANIPSILKREKMDDGSTEITLGYKQVKSLYVYRFDDLKPLLAEGLKTKVITRLKQRFLGLPVYSTVNTKRRPNAFVGYFYATPFNELLVADNPEDIKLMVSAGEGHVPNILTSNRYIDLEEIIPDLPSRWSFFFNLPRTAQDDSSEKVQVDPGQQLFSIYAFDVSDKIVEMIISVYANEDSAASALSELTGRVTPPNPKAPKRFYNYAIKKQERTKYARDENRVITTTVYDREFLEARQLYMKQLRMQAERRKKVEESRKR